jgi:signal transduction histidine kinase
VARFGLYAAGRPIHLQLPEHPPRVWADAVQIREVFANLVSNAVHYLDKDSGRVEISCRPEGAFYIFCVADNGPGIPAAIRDRLFEPFVRGSASPGHPHGTGLGLYFVRTMIEENGGRIWVESTPGQGSQFFFTLPRVPPAETTERQSAIGSPPTAESR